MQSRIGERGVRPNSSFSLSFEAIEAFRLVFQKADEHSMNPFIFCESGLLVDPISDLFFSFFNPISVVRLVLKQDSIVRLISSKVIGNLIIDPQR